MYLKHYNLKTKPFGISPDNRFLWLSEKHAEALATLQYGILDNKGFLLVTGDVGTGKTVLINRLIKDFEIEAIVATIPDPGLDVLDFFRILAVEFNMNTKFSSKGEFLIRFKNFLLKAYAEKNKVLLIIDEAQRLNHELLEQIRLLSNIELYNRKLINIFFVGQPEFNDMLMEVRNRAVRQRITLKYNIAPLNEPETHQYVKHRLKIAGATDKIFTPAAIGEIFALTNGYPRLINIICDHALLSGYVLAKNSIDRQVIKECEKELSIRIPSKEYFAHDDKQKDVILADDEVLFTEPEKSFGGKRIGLIIFLIMMPIAVIYGFYFLYNLWTGNHYTWSLNEIAPQEYTERLPQKPSSSVGATENENKKKRAQPGTNDQLTEQMRRNQILQPIQRPAESVKQNEAIIEAKMVSSQQTEFNPKNTELTAPTAEYWASPSGGRKIIVYFNYNSNQLSIDELEKLDYAVKLLYSPESKVIIEGFTDSQGDYYYNQQLSKFRADVVKNYFVGREIASEKIEVFGRGPANPIASNDTMEGRRRNRRVEVRIK
jgi:general secretion pathway protein A